MKKAHGRQAFGELYFYRGGVKMRRGDPMTEKHLRTALFVFRCVGASISALALAGAVGLPHSVWSAMSALIISQDRLEETRISVIGRIAGTVIGIGTACGINLLLAPYGVSIFLQMGIAVTFCSLLAYRVPQLRVSMWTCPLVLAAASPEPVLTLGFNRAAEVILGTLVGGLFHAAAEGLLRLFKIKAQAGPSKPNLKPVEGD